MNSWAMTAFEATYQIRPPATLRGWRAHATEGDPHMDGLEQPAEARVGDILTVLEPFGPPDADSLFARSSSMAIELIDRTNVVFARAALHRPVYLVGRKGAGKTAFLKGTYHGGAVCFEELVSGSVYSKYLGFIRRFQERHAPL